MISILQRIRCKCGVKSYWKDGGPGGCSYALSTSLCRFCEESLQLILILRFMIHDILFERNVGRAKDYFGDYRLSSNFQLTQLMHHIL